MSTVKVTVMIVESTTEEDKFNSLSGYSDDETAFVHHNVCGPLGCQLYGDEVWYPDYTPSATIKVTTECNGSTHGPTELVSLTSVAVGCKLWATKLEE